MRELTRNFTTKHVVPHLANWEHDGVVPRELHVTATHLGLLGASTPEKVGGSGGNALDMLAVLEEIILSGGSSGLVSALFSDAIATPHILSSGNTDLVDRYARPALAGQMVGSLHWVSRKLHSGPPI